ncbi:variant erythrocyte surface antigen-1 family protein, partial [Babesia divergens]
FQSSSGSVSSSSSGSGCSCPNSGAYLCTAINKDTVHDHCLKDSCRGFPGSSVSCTTHSSSNGNCKPCPHPLMRFLCHSKPNSDSESYPFGLSDIVPMGFSQGNLSSTAVQGEKLYHDIYGFCKDGFYPLTRLVQFILCVSRYPETLGELFAFFKKFADALNSEPLKDHFVPWVNGEPGSYSGSDLKTALENLYGSSHSNGSHTPASLYSLSSCHANRASKASCGPYLHALTEDVSGVFTPELCSMYLSWICYLAKDFYSEFKDFYDKASTKFSCCLSSS